MCNRTLGAVVLVLMLFLFGCSNTKITDGSYTEFVNPMIGTRGGGQITPVVSVPFGMIQMGADTRMSGSGYNYEDTEIIGFSHVHKSGGGCGDFLDLRFMPLDEQRIPREAFQYPSQLITSKFSHDQEEAHPGYYKVKLEDFEIDVELTATSRCGIQKYIFPEGQGQSVLIDLKYGSTGACTIVSEDNYDTVKVACFELVDDYTVRGCRVTNGWAPEQHVYFYTQFSKPVSHLDLYSDDMLLISGTKAKGTDLKAVLYFDEERQQELMVKTGISAVDLHGAQKNLEAEMPAWNFDEIRTACRDEWDRELSKIKIKTEDKAKKEIFYTSIYNTLKYPMLYSDVDGRFRGPDFNVHTCDFPYYGQVVGLWDTFRAACPLLTILAPEVMNDYVRTLLEHYKIAGQLPVWVLAGGETYQMLGLHSLPVIADCYYKGIRNYDADEAFEAMKTSAMQDTTGFSMRYFVGLKNYKNYGYVPADLEMESVARTLEYAYNDWNVAQMAKMLDKAGDYDYFLKRSASYKNVYDEQTKLMRGRLSDGSWRIPFDPLASNHRRDDYCEGNAWQWTFFVPHDVQGLADLMGGDDFLIARLDSLFSLSSIITGENTSGDISGLIGQYAHGNEPSHHTAYMYGYLKQPWKTQEYVHQILTTLYDTTPDGICGNDDTGQMSAWYVLSSMGFYPVRHGDGTYVMGSPLFDEVSLDLPNGEELTLRADNLSDTNIFIQSVSINGTIHDKPFFKHEDLMKGGEILFEMGGSPNRDWGID